MDKKVTVLEVEGSKIKAGCSPDSCAGCKAGLFCNRKNTSFSLDIPEASGIKKGDDVIINLPTGKTILVILLTFGLPLVLFVPGYFLFHHFFSSELMGFSGGILFLILGFLIAGIVFKIKKKSFAPVFLEKCEK